MRRSCSARGLCSRPAVPEGERADDRGREHERAGAAEDQREPPVTSPAVARGLGSAWWSGYGRVMGEDRLLQLLQIVAGVEPELVA